MLHFPELRMRRLIVQLRELTIGQAIKIASIPAHLEESSCTKFLEYATDSVKVNATSSLSEMGGVDKEDVSNPASWTIQERVMAVCHYLASTAEDGNPNFKVGDGNYMDYLDATMESAVTPFSVGSIGGDEWFIKHMTGGMAETIEKLSGEIDGISNKLHWIVGGMACQLARNGESVPDHSNSDFDQFIADRMKIILEFPETEFESLMLSYLAGREKLHHLFTTAFSDEGGIVALPIKKEGGEAVNLPPARFPVHSCLSRLANELAKRPD